MPFGISSAAAIFQKFVEEIVAGIKGCSVYLDDIMITGHTHAEHVRNITELFRRLEKQGLKGKKDKCSFAKASVQYVGHIIDSNGIRPSEKRVDATKNMPRPSNIKEMEPFIGKINYYNKFIAIFSKTAVPLNELKRANTKFIWAERQERAFISLKNDIAKVAELVHYSDEYPIILATDASKHGIGAVLSQRFPDGTENPICFASKT